MSAALVVVGLLVIVLMITAVVAGARRNRIRRHRDETPEDRLRREIPDLRPRRQTSLGGNGDAAEAPRPVVEAGDLAAQVQRAVQDAPHRELFGDYRRAKRRRNVWAAGTAGTMGATHGFWHIGLGGGGRDCDGDDRGGGDCDGGGCGGGGCGGGGD